MTLPQIIVHRLSRSGADSESVQVTLMCREQALPVNEVSEQLVDELHRNFNRKSGKAWAKFAEQASFADALGEYREQQLEFVDFSARAGQELIAAINRHALGQEGYLVFAHYQSLTTEYLLIGLLDEGESMAINEQLEINRASSLAVNSLSLAARIELSAMGGQAGSEQGRTAERPPIAFIKGRAGRKVADFFLEFLGCEEVADSKEETQALMSAVEDYCQEIQLDKQEAGELKQKLVQHCKEQVEVGDTVNLQAISEELETDAATSFYDFAASMEQPLHEEIPLEAASLRKMVKLSGSGGGVSINFDKHLLGERVVYDPVNDVLTIRELPKGLKKQIRDIMGLDEFRQ